MGLRFLIKMIKNFESRKHGAEAKVTAQRTRGECLAHVVLAELEAVTEQM